MSAVVALMAYQVASGLIESSNVRKQARISRRINEQNAKYIELDAWETEKYGYTQSSRYKTMVDATAASQKSAYASQGVDVTSGTAAEVQAETQLTGFLNIMDIQNAAREKAMGLRRQADIVRMGGAFQQMEARSQASGAITRGIIGAATTGVTAYPPTEAVKKTSSGYGIEE